MNKTLDEHITNLVTAIQAQTKADGLIFSSFDPSEVVMRALVEREIKFRVLLGRYNSVYETSYAVDFKHFKEILESGLANGQESFLIVSNETGRGYLVYSQINPDNSVRIEDIGTLYEINPEDAASVSAWSYDPEDGLYWGTRAA